MRTVLLAVVMIMVLTGCDAILAELQAETRDTATLEYAYQIAVGAAYGGSITIDDVGIAGDTLQVSYGGDVPSDEQIVMLVVMVVSPIDSSYGVDYVELVGLAPEGDMVRLVIPYGAIAEFNAGRLDVQGLFGQMTLEEL